MSLTIELYFVSVK